MMLPLPAKALYIFLLAHQHDASSSTRRCFLDSIICATTVVVLVNTDAATAADDVSPFMTSSDPLYLARPIGIGKGDGNNSTKARPSAPIEFLIPATRVGLYIYQLSSIVEELAQLREDSSTVSSAAANTKSVLVEQLEKLLLSPPSFITSTDPTVTRGDPYNNMPPLIGELAVQQQKQKERKEQSMNDIGMAPQLFEVGELMGERIQWSRLVQAERKREEASEVRRAMNIYTTNLNFDKNKYVYSGSKEEKKKLVREDRLPSATEVIRSDLDARDLHRNEVQTKLEDVRAEYLYQKGVGLEDLSELVVLLKETKLALDSWFGFIPDEDIKLALEAVKREQQT
eukprot:scaffold8741_cov142-Skeletonema_menzelii.AAC.6